MKYTVAFALAIAVSTAFSQTRSTRQKMAAESPTIVDACPSKPDFDKIKTTPSSEKKRGGEKGGETQETLHTLTEAEYQHLLEAVQTLAAFNARQWAVIDENQNNRAAFHGGFDHQIISTNETTQLIESTEVYKDGYTFIKKPVPYRPRQRIDVNSPQYKAAVQEKLRKYKAVTDQMEEASKTNAVLKAKVQVRKRILARMERESTTKEVFITSRPAPMGSKNTPAKKDEK